MTESEVSKPKPMTVGSSVTLGRLFVLDLSGGRVFSVNADGSDQKDIITGCRHPDGIAVDVEARHIYWTNMGVPNLNDGSIERADLDGSDRKTIVPKGSTFTPKQLHLNKKNDKLYWADREGMRIMRCNLEGSKIETLVESGHGDTDRRDATKWCVGIAVDIERGQIYWTQKGPDKAGKGRIFRAGIEIPEGQSASNRTDIEVLFDDLPEPIDLDLDLDNRMLYWTDRGDPPRGNTVNRAPLDGGDQKQKKVRQAPQILLNHLMEGIGIALDLKGEQMFLTDLAGSVYSAKLSGSDKKEILYDQGNLTGIAYAELPSIPA
jgi:Low-density lipoprotein receptor repeat class B